MSERLPSGPGACHDLLPEVTDKYFLANGNRQRFEFVTARAICMGGCAVQATCLAEAIRNPSFAGVRGGESAESIRALNYQMRREGTPASVLADIAIGHQLKPLRSRYGEPGLRAGHFTTPPLAFPEMGGEL